MPTRSSFAAAAFGAAAAAVALTDGEAQIVRRPINSTVPGPGKRRALAAQTDAPNDLGWFNVVDYGAVGDGKSNAGNQAAVEAAISAAASAGGGIIYFPAGVFVLSGTLTISANSCIIQGSGYGTTTLASTSGSTPIISFTGVSETLPIVDVAVKRS